MIKKLKAINFKSFESIDIELSDLNAVIGPNASGKSNFASVFQFIRDISTLGFDNAISLQGGFEYINNFKNSQKQPIEIEIQFDNSGISTLNKFSEIEFSSFSYDIKIFPLLRRKGIKKYIEEISLKPINPKDNAYPSDFKIISDNGKVSFQPELSEFKKMGNLYRILVPFQFKAIMGVGSLISAFPLMAFLGLSNSIQVYDFDPKMSKKAIPISGKAELELDGSNTALVLRNMQRNQETRNKFIQYLKVCLPFVKDLSVESQVDKSIILKVKESYNPKEAIPSSIISDGTLELISLIYALFFDGKRLIIIEEPERNIHPNLIANLMQLIKEASQEKQIIITTHSPELIKYLEEKDILVIKRDKNGASKVSHVLDKSMVRSFLKSHVGISDLFVDGILS